MSQSDFYTVLDECVSRLRHGEPAEACLVDYPAHAAELAPDLALTAELFQLEHLEPSPDGVTAGYREMMAALDNQETASPLASVFAFIGELGARLWRPQPSVAAVALRVTVIGLVVLVAAGSLVLTAAADTLPGDVLYPVKRSWESARLSLTVDDSSRQALQSELKHRRREEVQAVLELRRPVEVEFEGEIESLVSEVWLVDGLDLTITGDTQVNGLAAVGQNVMVRAQVRDDGSLYALMIVVEGNEPPTGTTPGIRPQTTSTSHPTRSIVTPGEVTPGEISPIASGTGTRPKPTATRKTTDQPTDQPTGQPTRTPAPSVDNVATRDVQPTSTRPTDSLATSTPRPTRTPAIGNPTPVTRPADGTLSTPTATSKPTRDLAPSATPTAMPNTDTSSGGNDRPP